MLHYTIHDDARIMEKIRKTTKADVLEATAPILMLLVTMTAMFGFVTVIL